MGREIVKRPLPSTNKQEELKSLRGGRKELTEYLNRNYGSKIGRRPFTSQGACAPVHARGASVKVRLDVYSDQRAKAKLDVPEVKLWGPVEFGGQWDGTCRPLSLC